MIINKIKYYLIMFLLILSSGCSNLNKNKVETIAQDKIKKEYKLPNLSICDDEELIKDGTLEEFFTWGIDIKNKFRKCKLYNNEKNEWIKRNFKEE